MAAPLRSLKLAGALGSVLACGVSGAVVATGPKPAAAPLRPPVDPRAPLVAAPVSPPVVRIPPTAVCTTVAGGSSSEPGSTVAPLDPAVARAVAMLRTAPPKTRRQLLAQLLTELTPQQRLALTARLRLAAPSKPGCAPVSAQGGGGGVEVSPSVTVAGPQPTPAVVSAVS